MLAYVPGEIYSMQECSERSSGARVSRTGSMTENICGSTYYPSNNMSSSLLRMLRTTTAHIDL